MYIAEQLHVIDSRYNTHSLDISIYSPWNINLGSMVKQDFRK